MFQRTVLGILALFGAMALPLESPQAATRDDSTVKRYNQAGIQQALRYVDQLEVQGQRLMTEALQVALQIEPEQSLARFKASHDYFVEVLHTLQNGDPERGLPVPQNPDLIAPLEALQQVWNQLDPMFSAVINSGSISRTNITLLTEFDNILVDLARQVEEAYEREFSETNLASIATATVVQAEHLSFLVERMQTEMLLIAFDHDVNRQRQDLAASMSTFERTLEGLLTGNPGLKLIPPPSAAIRAQLRSVRRIWDEVAPILEPLARGGEIDRATVVHLVNRMEPLYEEMEQAVALY